MISYSKSVPEVLFSEVLREIHMVGSMSHMIWFDAPKMVIDMTGVNRSGGP